jgi:hypothetical protein
LHCALDAQSSFHVIAYPFSSTLISQTGGGENLLCPT